MAKKYKFNTLRDSLSLLLKEAKAPSLSFREVLRVVSPKKGRAFILLMLSLPFCLPVQIPGLSTPFGIVIAFVGLRFIFGKHVWIPKKILEKRLSASLVKKILRKALFAIEKIKKFVHPRIDWMCHSSFMKGLHGVSVFLLGMVLALPLPIPFTNLIVAWPIFLIAFGLLEDDGLVVLIGYGFFLLAAGYFFLLSFLTEKIL
jgi:hypothetical protein